ncbi:MAG: hydrogenase formation protein HypD [Lentisphaerae bacterium]|nr:hydrogenase formation protein HypD [Lentisphaerota bacterium]
MKHIDEYRGREQARTLAAAIARHVTRPWTIMEVCGGQTHAIVRFGIDSMLPPAITLLHGPGCPVCVTSLDLIDKAIAIASRADVIFCSFGDMLRVPGSCQDLLSVKAAGGDVRILYSPMDALQVARDNPHKQVVMFAVGFETTAPATAMAIHQARTQGLTNFYVLVAHVLVPPAIATILGAPGNRVQAFLAAGHVCAVMGYSEYEPLARQFKVPIVVTGFEPVDILQGILRCVIQLEAGRAVVENAYARAVRRDGNTGAQTLMRDVFHVVPRQWRGVGSIASSGLGLTPAYARMDAERHFGLSAISAAEPSACISGLILQGQKKPHECPAFGKACTPEHPWGATMVSAEGACAAYYRYRRTEPVGAGAEGPA